MTAEPAALISLASAATAGLAVAAAAGLQAWHGWLELKRMEMARGRDGRSSTPGGEVKHLKERVRRLEAIAFGAE